MQSVKILDHFVPIINTTARINDLSGGRGRGGSHFATTLYMIKMLTKPYFRGYFMRAVFGDIKESLYRDFKDRCDEYGQTDNFIFNDSNYSVKCRLNQNIIISKGFKKSAGTQTAKLKSIAGATDVLIEECEEVNEDDYNQLQDSLRTTKSPIHVYRVWNPPPKDHWLIKKYYDIFPHPDYEGFFYYKAKGIEGHLGVFATYLNNYENIDKSTRELWESYKITNPDHYASDILGLVSGGVKGQVYKNWKVFNNLPEELEYTTIFGIDFGYANSRTAIVECRINKETKACYKYEHMYEREVLSGALIQKCKECNPDNLLMICDNARPETIAELQSAGLNVLKTKKGEGSIKAGIDIVSGYEDYVHINSENLQYEKNHYKWGINAKTKEPSNEPEKKNDDHMDAERYVLRYYHLNYML